MKKNTMKLVYIIMGILILIIVLNFTSIYKKNNLVNSETLVKAFNSTGAKIINYEIYFFGTLGDDFNNLEDLRNLSNNFVSDMNINNKKLINNEMDNNDIKKIDIDGVSSDGRIIKLSFVIQKNNDKTKEKSVSVSITEDLKILKYRETIIELLNIFKKYKIKPKMNSCIVGNFDGKLKSEKMDIISDELFKILEAKKIEGINEKGLISISAYSPYLSENIKVKGKNVNLNLAIRYNEFENKTYIWLATPIITIEY